MYQTIAQWRALLESETGQKGLCALYGVKDAAQPLARHMAAFDAFSNAFQRTAGCFFSASGRTELSGNHTDHQNGRVLAGAVTMDMLAVACPNETKTVRALSEGYPQLEVNLADLRPSPRERNHTAALVRGVAAGLAERGVPVGGFDIYIASAVPKGSGLSSSAALEVLLGTAMNHMFGHGAIDAVTLAHVGQQAENVYFGKPCGLLDQMSIALGGITYIDFGAAEPEKMTVDLQSLGYEICIVNAGGSHANLTQEYAAIPGEMRAVARAMGHEVLGEAAAVDFYAQLPSLRERVGDRALVRAAHFFAENQRVPSQRAALRRGDMESYKKLMLDSGRSSYDYLQNIYPSGDISERSISLALCLSERLLDGKGAWRVHGGGFAGTIQALVPLAEAGHYCAAMAAVFGADQVFRLSIRPVGGISLWAYLREAARGDI